MLLKPLEMWSKGHYNMYLLYLLQMMVQRIIQRISPLKQAPMLY